MTESCVCVCKLKKESTALKTAVTIDKDLRVCVHICVGFSGDLYSYFLIKGRVWIVSSVAV